MHVIIVVIVIQSNIPQIKVIGSKITFRTKTDLVEKLLNKVESWGAEWPLPGTVSSLGKRCSSVTTSHNAWETNVDSRSFIIVPSMRPCSQMLNWRTSRAGSLPWAPSTWSLPSTPPSWSLSCAPPTWLITAFSLLSTTATNFLKSSETNSSSPSIWQSPSSCFYGKISNSSVETGILNILQIGK